MSRVAWDVLFWTILYLLPRRGEGALRHPPAKVGAVSQKVDLTFPIFLVGGVQKLINHPELSLREFSGAPDSGSLGADGWMPDSKLEKSESGCPVGPPWGTEKSEWQAKGLALPEPGRARI